MTRNARALVQRTLDSSWAVRFARLAMSESAVCRAAARMTGPLRRTRERIVAGLGGAWSADEGVRARYRLDGLAAQSQLIGTLSTLLNGASAARKETVVRHLFAQPFGADPVQSIRLGAYAIIVATLTHSFLLGVLGVPVHTLGWLVRVVLMAAGAAVAHRPHRMAVAWADRRRERPRT